MVHGGLRYLKQLEIGLVAEVGKERAIVYENGPHVTTPEWMLLPIVKGGTFITAGISIGLFLLRSVGRVKKEERRRMLNPAETLQREPLLRGGGRLKGAGLYVEYRTDDARLTLEVLKEAVKRGALAANYAKAENLLYRDGKVIGAEVLDTLTGGSYRIRAKKVVNATGPWVDSREKDGSKTGKTIQWSKGITCVTDQKHFPSGMPSISIHRTDGWCLPFRGTEKPISERRTPNIAGIWPVHE